MTDKEQIKCKYMFQDKEKFDGKPYCICFCELCEDLPPCDDNCQIYEDYKQLTHKTQECEELKKYISEKEGIGDDCDYCKHNDKYNCYQNIFLDNLKEINRYKQALEPFEDEYFKGLDTKQIAELAKKSIRLTTENRKLENKLSDIAGICSQILDGEDYVRRIAKTILDIID